uniref:TOG domain-containing protein n=1 Tax=Kwoniella pini CBS 10737 TaxID=1296096 RepID=A0A1B9HT48_9TREE|nr:uncharacterized protein I206_07674 [Kwoniella pini CBS 10737]OCF46440.1 hypothetical protein I206_07674 [Kwoniella pini CBS 10737]
MKNLSEEDVEARIVKLKNAEPDKKVDIIQAFGLAIEEVTELPESTIDPIILLLPPLIRSSHPLLQISTLTSFLPFFIPLIPQTPNSHLRLTLLQILPALIEKLNDPKDRIHTASNNVIFQLGKSCYIAESTSSSQQLTSSAGGNGGVGSKSISAKGKEKETLVQTFERYLKDTLNSKSWRSKVELLKILARLKIELGSKLSLKGWLGILVDLLEDSDGNVRDQAKETVVALLSPSSTPAAARSEMKKLLLARNVRKTISNDIIARVIGGENSVESGRSTPALASSSIMSEQPAEEVKSDGRSGTATPVVSGENNDDIEIVYIASPHDVLNEMSAMLPYFEGKETEHNWLPREKSVIRIRGMLKGGVWTKFHETFIQGLKSGILEGVSKTIVSLRTTVAQQSCYLMKELTETLGPSFDQFVDHLLPILAKMSGYTKKIIAERSQACMTAIIIHTHIHPRIFIAHIAAGVSDKNIQTRHFSTGHLKTFIDIHGSKSKHSIETTPGALDQLEGAVKKSLVDVNPAVRDLARQAFWSYHAVWRSRADVILNSLDGMARRQLEKFNPHNTDNILSAPVPTKAAPPVKRATSSVAALLAEKRKAKAAELAAGKMVSESPRIVSGPTPASPSIMQQGSYFPRSNSSASLSKIQRPDKSTTPESSPQAVPLPASPSPDHSVPGLTASPTPARQFAMGSPKDLLSQNSKGRDPLPKGSPSRDSPLRQSSTNPFASSGLRSPGSSTSSNSTTEKISGSGLATPSRIDRSFSREAEVDVDDENWSAVATPTRTLPEGNGVVEDARRAQAAQAESAARQLMEYVEDEEEAIPSTSNHPHHNIPVTPARPTNGHSETNQRIKDGNGNGLGSAYKTPSNIGRRQIWEDSPRPESVTPLMIERLKERRHERSWWVKRQELMDKASPLKSNTLTPSSAITDDIEALMNGSPTLRNLQKISLFSTSHPINTDEAAIEDNNQRVSKIWEDDKVFERILAGLMSFIKPDQEKEILEQGLVVLWEMVQHQWILFDGHEQELVETLFRLRESHDSTILESTNALISLLTQISDPIYFLTLIKSCLIDYLNKHSQEIDINNNDNRDERELSISKLEISSKKSLIEKEKILNSGWLFGLTALSMCILQLPLEVVEIEGEKLGKIITDSMLSNSSIIRQSCVNLILSIQIKINNSNKILNFLNLLNKGQKDLIIYYMEKNKILENPSTTTTTTIDDDDNDDNYDNNEKEKEKEKEEKILKDIQNLIGRNLLDSN